MSPTLIDETPTNAGHPGDLVEPELAIAGGAKRYTGGFEDGLVLLGVAWTPTGPRGALGRARSVIGWILGYHWRQFATPPSTIMNTCSYSDDHHVANDSLARTAADLGE